MEKELLNSEKQLLLVDLCSRLPYVVRGVYKTPGIEITCQKLTYDIIGNLEYKNNVEFKPYLFPLSSMTEEQKKEEYEICKYYLNGYESKLIDFYHKNQLDYRGLIDKGLAIDCTNLNVY